MLHPAKILSQYDLHALKKLGQNFMTSQAPLEFLQEKLRDCGGVLEIGPGLGCITEILKGIVSNLHVIEKDSRLENFLKENIIAGDRFILGDFLELANSKIIELQVDTIVGNLPFYITTPIIEKIILELPAIQQAFLGVQLEYAQRASAPSGNSLAIFLQGLGDVEFLKKVNRKTYFPVPNVDTAWFVWRRKILDVDSNKWQTMLRMSFWGKRKNLENNLKKNPHLPLDTGQLKHIPKSLLARRPDDLNVSDFREIYFSLEENLV